MEPDSPTDEDKKAKQDEGKSLRAHINLHTSSLLILCMVVTTTTKRNNARVFKFNEKWKDGRPWLK